jgi:muramoyltetrapeptide carboxypeptidase
VVTTARRTPRPLRTGDRVALVAPLGFGHCRGQLTVPLGAQVELDADAATLRLIAPRL